jgi:signal transduction histidine kinase
MHFEETPTARGLEVLVVEDSPTQAVQLEYILEQHNLRVATVHNGREAVAWLSQHKPAMVISDILMPEMDGYELCRYIKGKVELRDIPVILLTFLSDTGDILKGLECGAHNFIVKPYGEEHIISCIQQVFAGKRLDSEEDQQGKLEIPFDGQEYSIRSSRSQILCTLISTYRTAIEKNNELIVVQEELRLLNECLEERVKERTAALLAEIAERRRVEDELRVKSEEINTMSRQLWQSVKLATMGELVASIAHELNNPLATVSLRVESLLMDVDPASPLRREIGIIEQEVDRMGALVANLLEFSRSSGQRISAMNVHVEIENTLELVHYHFRNRSINVVQELDPDVPLIEADRQQFRQLLLNLFTNAGDAMPNGGTLTIRVSVAGHEIMIEIADTGVGIATENLQRIMEPFFTTKPKGKGTGLGLPICRRIVQEHGGKLWITSVANKETTVHISLPLQSKMAEAPVREEE